MKTLRTPIAALRLGVALFTLGLVGCASASRTLERNTPREEVAESVDAAAAQVAEVNGRIDVALRALADLTSHPESDLKRQFNGYTDAVTKLEDATNKLRDESETMERKGREYLVSWDRQIATIHDGGLRNRTTERRQAVAESIDALHESYVTARERLAPLLQRLNEIESTIRVDLTNAGIGAVRPTVSSATDTASPARDALRELAEAYRRAAAALAPVAPSA